MWRLVLDLFHNRNQVQGRQEEGISIIQVGENKRLVMNSITTRGKLERNCSNGIRLVRWSREYWHRKWLSVILIIWVRVLVIGSVGRGGREDKPGWCHVIRSR